MYRISRNFATIAIVFFVTVLFVGQIQAQPGRGGRGPMLPDSSQIVQMTEDLAKAVNLTPEQKTKVSEIHFAHFAEIKNLREKNQGDRETRRNAGKELRDKMDTDIKALLTDEQKQAFDKYVTERRSQQGTRGGQRPNTEIK